MSNFRFSLRGCSGVRTPDLLIIRWTFYHQTTLPPIYHDRVELCILFYFVFIFGVSVNLNYVFGNALEG